MQGKPLETQQKQKFLARLKSSHGNVSAACKSIGISRNAAYDHKKTDADFSAAWEEVIESVVDEAEKELFVRSVKGWSEPVFYKGEIVGTIRKKSDRLLEFFLKGNRAEKFRERLDLNAHHSGSLDVNIQASIDKIYDEDAGARGDTDLSLDADTDAATDTETEGLAGDAEPDQDS